MTGSYGQLPVFMIVPTTPCRVISTDPSSFSLCRNTTALPAVAYPLISRLESFLGAAATHCHGHCSSSSSSSQAISWHQPALLHSPQLPSWAEHTSRCKIGAEFTTHLVPLEQPHTLSWHNEESLFTKYSQKAASCCSSSELCSDDSP